MLISEILMITADRCFYEVCGLFDYVAISAIDIVAATDIRKACAYVFVVKFVAVE